ncbi:MAG: hypothetical protein Q8R45_00180 [Brevundimonas sp.]|uniref:hypothetical protein n=1 Tax=Brevundimonas sp. TaxID=1871086 RepID=UPI00273621BE|nr:hypothetical protein [Brevundimonas sp.]MDP3655372.1 hypothetical protein [Brevundimonas sp.]MDZ4109249.1 hypothetical protein [Brevundimonas sp.]
MTWIAIQPVLLGLGAIVLGLIGNTILEWVRLSLASRHQRMAVRRALIAELEGALELADSNYLKLKQEPVPKGQVLQTPIRERYPAFTWAMPNIGLLRGPEITAVFNAYDYLDSWIEIIVCVGKLERVEGRLFGHVPAENSETVMLAGQDRVEHLRAALTELRRNVNR